MPCISHEIGVAIHECIAVATGVAISLSLSTRRLLQTFMHSSARHTQTTEYRPRVQTTEYKTRPSTRHVTRTRHAHIAAHRLLSSTRPYPACLLLHRAVYVYIYIYIFLTLLRGAVYVCIQIHMCIYEYSHQGMVPCVNIHAFSFTHYCMVCRVCIHIYTYISHSQHTCVYSAAQILQVACRAHRKMLTFSGCGPLHVLQICGRAVFSLLRLCLRVLRVHKC